jgi:Ca-activated chloride channel family protein
MADGAWWMAVGLAAALAMQPAFHSRTDLVAMNVTVVDGRGNFVRGLTQDAFTVTEDLQLQPIAQFAAETVPLSLVIAVDASNSMAGARIRYAREAVLRFLDRIGADDEFYVFGFNYQVFNITRGTKDRDEVALAMAAVHPNGGTALYDAVPAGILALQHAKHRRRALVLITDGNDWVSMPKGANEPAVTAGRESFAVDAVRRSEALVYAVGVDPRHAGQRVNAAALERLAIPAGGTVRLAATDAGILTAAEQIGDELRLQYVIGFAPAHPGDGRFHRVQVSVPGCPACRVRTRAGYIGQK